MSVVGRVDFFGGEMTGTGDGRLFSFVGTSPAELVEFDKDDGSVAGTAPLPGLETTDAFAMAFWAGDFYFFTERVDTVGG